MNDTKSSKYRANAKTPYHSKTREERAEINRANGKKSPEIRKMVAYPKPDIDRRKYGSNPTPTSADMLADIYDPRAKYPPEKKIHAATCYMLTGNCKDAAKMAGLKHHTVKEWRRESQWWEPVLAKVRKEKQDELDAMMTNTIHSATEGLLDRIQNGEEVIVKTGDTYEKVKKQMSGRDLASTVNFLYNNRASLRGEHVSQRAQGAMDTVKKLKEMFEDMAKGAAKEEFNKTVVNEK